MRQRPVGDVEVVADEIALRQAASGEEELVLVRERDVVRADPHRGTLEAMRKAALAALLALCRAGVAATTAQAASTTPPLGCSKDALDTVNDGKLTIGTDNPAYPPWFGGGEVKGSKWKVNDPSTGKGFESAVAYAVAKHARLTRRATCSGRTCRSTRRSRRARSRSTSTSTRSRSRRRARRSSTFSDSYYDVNQAIVVLKGTPIAKVQSVAGLRDYKLGAQLGTTSYAYITNTIKPSKSPSVFDDNAPAIQALKNKQIDGLVVDLPTAFYVTAVQVPNGDDPRPVPDGRRAVSTSGWSSQKGSSLTGCVDRRAGRR